MKLIGMMDSPYVRRVAISLELYGIQFVSVPLSVFSTFDAFSQINPVVKAPTAVLDNGLLLMGDFYRFNGERVDNIVKIEVDFD